MKRKLWIIVMAGVIGTVATPSPAHAAARSFCTGSCLSLFDCDASCSNCDLQGGTKKCTAGF